MPRMTVRLTVAAALLAGGAFAHSQDAITVRAVGPHVSEDLVRFIAQHAMPHPTDAVARIIGQGAAPRNVIARLCGAPLRADYYAEFVAQNKAIGVAVTSPDMPLGAGPMVWPACLQVDIPPNGVEAKVGEGETASHVYARLTGGGATEPALEHFFRRSVAAGVNLKSVREGQSLIGAHATAPVRLVPRSMDVISFWGETERIAGAAGEPRAMIRHITDPAQGEIIASDENNACNPVPGVPYDPFAVKIAYDFAKGRAGRLPREAQIAVVDNGFFGAQPNLPNNEFKDSPFSKDFFESDPSSLIKQRFMLDRRVVYPINYSNGYLPNLESGHGTHVTGLVLGGPGFLPYRDSLITVDGKPVPWAKVMILNVGVGTRSLLKGAYNLFQGMLGGSGSIVNMSISYDPSFERQISRSFNLLFERNPHLYVVAAGNGYGKDVSAKVYPAGAGGLQTPNVITIAALDGDGRISRFSNIGRDTVDMAAPGCQIASWIKNDHNLTLLSGTSQAAPQVTFAAALLRTLTGPASPRLLKARLISSGRLLDPRDQFLTAYRVSLDITRALFWFDDYVRLAGDRKGEYLGDIAEVRGVRCKEGHRHDVPTADVWALKRDPTENWLYLGRDSEKLREPCAAAETPAAVLRFTPRFRVTPTGIVPVNESEWQLRLAEVEGFIFRTPLTAD